MRRTRRRRKFRRREGRGAEANKILMKDYIFNTRGNILPRRRSCCADIIEVAREPKFDSLRDTLTSSSVLEVSAT
jgi:hypothetical protein